MAASLKTLREIMLTVEPPKPLVDRITEMPLLIPHHILEGLKKAKTREESQLLASQMMTLMTPDADEVYPNIFIGNYKAVNTNSFLKERGITHVLNAAEGTSPGMVPPIAAEQLEGIKYHALLIGDSGDPKNDIEQVKLFREGADIIETCLKQGMTAGDAMALLKVKRDVWPSDNNLVHVAYISNDVHGYPNDDVIDADVGVLQFRSQFKNVLGNEPGKDQ